MCTHACEVSEGRQSKQYNNQIGGDILPIKACTLGTRKDVSSTNDNHSSQEVDNNAVEDEAFV